MSRRPKWGRFVLGTAISLAVLLPTGPQVRGAEYDDCPGIWTEVTDTQVGHLTLFCKQPAPIGPTFDEGHFLKVPKQHVAQSTVFASDPTNVINGGFGSSSDPDPWFLKKNVAGWIQHIRETSGYSNVDLVINGTFFKCFPDELCGALHPTESTLSYPTARQGSSLANTGSELDPNYPRVCLSFGNGNDPQVNEWTLNSNDWEDVEDNLLEQCDANAYHKVVTIDPDAYIGGPGGFGHANHRTYVGIDGDELCFLVGGWFRNDDMEDVFADFGCEVAAQLDGGPSSQLSYYDSEAEKYYHPVDGFLGYDGEDARLVPHFFAIF